MNNQKIDSTESAKEIREGIETLREIPVIQETAHISKDRIATGKVTLEKRVETENVPLSIELKQHTVQVTRVPKDELLDNMPEAIRTENGKTIYSVIEEEVITLVKYRLVEEIVVEKQENTTLHKEEVALRKEHIDVQREELQDGQLNIVTP